MKHEMFVLLRTMNKQQLLAMLQLLFVIQAILILRIEKIDEQTKI